MYMDFEVKQNQHATNGVFVMQKAVLTFQSDSKLWLSHIDFCTRMVRSSQISCAIPDVSF